MNFYVKKLGLNEMTISKGLGTGQRGRFILISPSQVILQEWLFY